MDLEFKKKLGDADWSATKTIMAGVGYPTGLFAFGNYLFSLGWDDANKDVNDLSAIKMVVSEDDGASWSSPKTVVEEVEMQSAGLTFHLPPPLPSPPPTPPPPPPAFPLARTVPSELNLIWSLLRVKDLPSPLASFPSWIALIKAVISSKGTSPLVAEKIATGSMNPLCRLLP